MGTAGYKHAIVEGANCAMGVATLTSGTGTFTVNNTIVTDNSRIFLTTQDPNGGIPGAAYISTRTSGTSFTILSTITLTDRSIIAWEIKEPN
jgi:hypothetical protein